MKLILSLVITICPLLLISQTNPKHSFFSITNDTFRLYIDKVGDVSTKFKADYYRETQVTTNKLMYKNFVKDYFMNGQLAFSTKIKNGSLNGKVKAYYKNGRLKYEGFYNQGMRDSTWIFYYKNQNIEKKVLYDQNKPYLKEYYKRNGKLVFDNGNGEYKGKLISSYKEYKKDKISGTIVDGKLDGEWKWNGNLAVEYFDNGKFIKGVSRGMVYDTNPVTSLYGFNLHEHVSFLNFLFLRHISRHEYRADQMLKYKNKINLNLTFSMELYNFLYDVNDENNLSNYSCFAQFQVTKENEIQEISVYSNSNIVSQELTDFIKRLTGFQCAQSNDNPVGSTIYFALFCEDGKLNIPNYSYDSCFINRMLGQ